MEEQEEINLSRGKTLPLVVHQKESIWKDAKRGFFGAGTNQPQKKNG